MRFIIKAAGLILSRIDAMSVECVIGYASVPLLLSIVKRNPEVLLSDSDKIKLEYRLCP
jgi:hypothetical protein